MHRVSRPSEEQDRFAVDLRCLTWSERGDGRQGVVRCELGGQTVALKFYGRKRRFLRSQLRDLGHRVYRQRSGTGLWERQRTERETLDLWRREGFHTPRCAELLDCPAGWEVPFLVLEWIEAPSMWDLIEVGDPSPEGVERMTWLAQELGRRHDRVLEATEPRLLHQHPILEHVLLDGDRLVTIDHELVSICSDRLDEQVGRELMGWIRSIYQSSLSRITVSAFCDAYPARDRLLGEMERLGRNGLTHARAWLRRVRRKRGRPSRGDLVEVLREWQEKTA